MVGRVWQRLRGGTLSPGRAGLSIFVGLFIGCQPLYGLHLPLCLLVCLPFRLDFVLAYLVANISNPFVAPFLLMIELEIGSWLIDGVPLALDVTRASELGLGRLAWQTFLGAQVLGAALAGAGAALGFVAVRSWQGRRADSPTPSAVERTVARYARCSAADRTYAAMKLGMDPLTKQLSELGQPLGRVLDIGAGRGQFSLLLLELGLASSVEGLDWDARKVRVAEVAARGQARFVAADALGATLPGYDTVLLFDVLHYLPPSQQDLLLTRCARELPIDGRLMIRELDKRPGIGSATLQWFERIAVHSGYNRAKKLSFRPLRQLVGKLEGLGFACHVRYTRPLPWSAANVFIVARRVESLSDDFHFIRGGVTGT